MRKALLLFLMTVVLLATLRLQTHPHPARATGTAKTTITILARVDEFSEWADPSPVVFQADWSGPIDRVNQKQTASRQLTLYTNTHTTVTIKPDLNGGILTRNGSSQTLDTAYRVTGDVAAPDAAFIPAHQFFSGANVYHVLHTPGTGVYHITVEVQMASPPDEAPDSGNYACGITLTAGW